MTTILQLPVRSDLEAYTFVTPLDGTNYQLGLAFNYREDIWVMEIAAADGTPILSGILLQTNVNLTGRFALPALPPGHFLAFDTTGNAADATRLNLGTDVVLLYQEASG